ncbi:hypothetical protein LNL84_10125 [Vibrio sp. ZSDZ34]|uniref:Outer membrane protein beta-barrel domain-containing protein n=1 Tax=Vibrio gelatinilyticus TaxID=2893468 RepID=A0A9X2AWA6_9VIBR|nr:hypothetical protein [Vibrio gelatinilyticus]MCJ2377185.1 hypothetical protein [Vibrio gelatinilyticus]
MNSFNLLALPLCITVLSLSSVSAQSLDTDEVNYGDPTASFSTLGASRGENSTMLNFQAGFGANIFQIDYGFNDKSLSKDPNKEGSQNYRARAFHVTEGLGFSATVVGSQNADDTKSDAVFVGALYKFELTDNILLFPMLDAGRSYGTVRHNGELIDNNSNIVQPGLYAMYAFDDGHWLYANPKAQYNVAAKEWVPQAEIGGGYMVSDSISVGFRLDHTGESKITKEDTKLMIQGNYYF